MPIPRSETKSNVDSGLRGLLRLDRNCCIRGSECCCRVMAVFLLWRYERPTHKASSFPDISEESLQRESNDSLIQHRGFLTEGASHSRELGYREEIEKLAAEVTWLTYVPTISRPWDDHEWHGETGLVEDLIRKYADLGLSMTRTPPPYLCGHPTMIENGKA